ncbi:MAG: penicillin-insensitive murein endopeptidase [Bdellovibrionaceae bacterium]|nr:penicillin-insensitive murein endopeptidase [Pseudobdellovibrionaceae bacterium]
MMVRRLLVLSMMAFVAACSSQDSFQASRRVSPTDPTVNERNPMIIRPTTQDKTEIKPEGATPIQLGYLSAEDSHVEKNGAQLKFSARVVLKDREGRVQHSRQVELAGEIGADGRGVLSPTGEERDSDPPVRARVTYIALSTPLAIIDLYMKDRERIHAVQLEAELDPVKKDEPRKKTPKKEPKKKNPTVKPSTPAEKPSAPSASKSEASPSTPSPDKDKSAPAPTTPQKNQPGVNHQTPASPAPVETSPEEEPDEEAPADEGDGVNDGADANEGVDPDDRPSFYVGTLYEGADVLFKKSPEAPKKEEPGQGGENAPLPPRRPVPEPEPRPAPMPAPPAKKKVHDQAIGSVGNGKLENATNLKDRQAKSSGSSATKLVAEKRARFYATHELVEIIDYLGRYARSSPSIGTLRVGDLSQENGGRMRNSAHKSHQNGLDADLGYPLKDVSERMEPFRALVSNGHIDPDLDIKATWALFKAAWGTKATDRIFVDQRIKEALCKAARDSGDIDAKGEGSAKELLRRIRPWPGHNTHFHLRIRCSVEQPRCRMMGDPREQTSGCS